MSKKVFELAAKLDFDTAKIMQKINKNASAAQKRLDAAVLADSNKYCPMQTGTLQKSAIIATVIGSGRISWVTPTHVDSTTSTLINGTTAIRTQRVNGLKRQRQEE